MTMNDDLQKPKLIIWKEIFWSGTSARTVAAYTDYNLGFHLCHAERGEGREETDTKGRRGRIQEENQETDTKRRRGMMKIKGKAMKGICEETDAEGRRWCLWLFALWCGRRLQFRIELGLGTWAYLFILPVRFTGLSGQTGTEPNRSNFSSVFSVFSVNRFFWTPLLSMLYRPQFKTEHFYICSI